MLPREVLADVAGVEECALPADVAEALPYVTPSPPWRCVIDGVVWLHRAAPGSVSALPAAWRSRPGLPLTFGMVVTYRENPVGPYDEVVASPRLLGFDRGVPVGYIPFIAVDSVTSVHGGRAHWALPKTLADFTGSPGGPRTEVQGDGWRLSVRPRPVGPRFPYASLFAGRQPSPLGAELPMRLSVRGMARLARVDVEVESKHDLATWLTPGRHWGLLLKGARLTVR